MAIKKTELYSKLWESCNELRGGLEASQYKNYVLALLFMKYVSDKSKSDTDFLIEVPQGGSFNDMIQLKGKPEIGDKINIIINKFAEANQLSGIFGDADFNNEDKLGRGKEMVDRLSKLIAIFEDPGLDFSKNRAEGDDLLGDAYEYLMRHFATESGKSKGQFYTPAEVSRVMAKVIEINKAKDQSVTVYDPTCGSGSLLLKAADETIHGITIYGQESELDNSSLAKMNMIIHNRPTAVHDIKHQNTMSTPLHLTKDGTLKTFDFVVANPPFSNKNWSNGIDPEHDEYGRFEGFGIPPRKNGDYAFLLHMIKSLKSTGKAAVILPHGVLFRGNAEGEIRKNIIKRGYIKGIIGLPPNLFYGTGIPACIIILDKENAESRKGIFMIDASKGFYKDGNKNRLRPRDIHKIVDVFTKQDESDPKYARMVSYSEISDEKNNYNLNIPRYIDSQEDEDIQDIEAHLKGDIPNPDIDALQDYWKIYPTLKNKLFSGSERHGYSSIKAEKDKIKSTIFNHPEFIDYSNKIELVYDEWQEKNVKFLKEININDKPKELIFKISENILETFSKLDLIDKYEIYQHLMSYWAETMQDDVYMLAIGGWQVEINIFKNKKGKETGWDCDLIPKYLVKNRYFKDEKEAIEKLYIDLEELIQNKETLEEEYSVEEDLFSECRGKSGNITKGELNKRIKAIKNDLEFNDELKVLQKYVVFIDQEAGLKKNIKEAEKQLDKELLKKYNSLTEDEIKVLVVDDKWLTHIKNSVDGEMERISQKLAGRVKELAERYETPLPVLTKDVDKLSKKVDAHLQNMGFKW